MKAIGIVASGFLLVIATAGSGLAEIQTGLSSITTTVGVYNGAGTSLGAIDGGGTAFGISGTAEVAKVNEKTTIEAGLLWFRDSSEYTQAVPGFPSMTLESSFRDISVFGGGRYYIRTGNEKIEPFVNGGLEIAFWKASVRSSIIGEEIESSVSDTDFGIYVGGGANYLASDNLLLSAGLGLHTPVSGYVSLNFGVTYMLGP